MFQNSQDLREFIVWCKDQKIKKVQIDTVSVEFSDLAYLDAISAAVESGEEKDTSKTLVDSADTSAEDEELLFWSTKG